MRGNATHLYLAYGIQSNPIKINEAAKFVTLNDGRSGPSESWPQERQELHKNVAPALYRLSQFAKAAYPAFYLKAKWPLPKTHNCHPTTSMEIANPLFVLSNTQHPVCPLDWTMAARDAFQDSRLVEVLSYGHCT